ncbi:MAG: hypothetical protein ACYCZZ_01235 [Minisyncoccota bacterium]
MSTDTKHADGKVLCRHCKKWVKDMTCPNGSEADPFMLQCPNRTGVEPASIPRETPQVSNDSSKS